MKNVFLCGFILGLFLSGCTATMHTTIEEQFRDQSLDVESIYSDGIALLPIAGSNQTFSSVVSIAADNTFRANEVDLYVGPRQVSNDLNSHDLVRDYQEMINNYNSSGVVDKSQLKKIGEATGTRYLLKIHTGSLNRAADTQTSYLDGTVQTREQKDVRMYGLLWDASNGNVVWEGATTTEASEADLTVINQEDSEFYQVATEELILQLLSTQA